MAFPALLNRLPDQTLHFIARGYDFTRDVWHAAGQQARATGFRVLGKRAVLVRGAEGVRTFYDTDRVKRHGAMPEFIKGPLFGQGTVHDMDGEAHRHRKATFVRIAYDDAQVERLQPLLEQTWAEEKAAWLAGGKRTAYDAAVGASGRAVMRWAGVPGPDSDLTEWAGQLAQIVDSFGAVSPQHLLARANRERSDRHAADLIAAVRAGHLDPAPGTALREIADHRELDGNQLDDRQAGVEFQNVIRPTIATSLFVALAGAALHTYPQWRERIAAETAERGTTAGGPLAMAFAQEVRRRYPFVPMLPATATERTRVGGETIEPGDMVLIDIQGTNLDDESWERPDVFDPERFMGVDAESIKTFVPQGGGDVRTGHRCPGEKIAVAAIAVGVATLSDPALRISGEGLDFPRHRMPTKPRSGVKVTAA
ncbi:cytochrome P450 [Nigerium massiliense]|uniref:cytochrome P450 n=1 Tax=Nigerium massiliense TaxID=1522317 RepID=UPI0006949B9F|nr:cytochrome P450 [Nigerium massiliense]